MMIELPTQGEPGIILDASTGGEPGITLDRVSFGYDDVLLVNDLSWELDAGDNAVITGSSGSGKSTLLQVAAGLLPPTRGTVLLAGHPLGTLLPSQRVARGLRTGFVFQEGGLLANLTVFANLELALLYHQDILELDDRGITERVESALDAAQISRSYWQTLPAHLSYGDRKRLALARAIALRPNFFFFDDPDVGMDQKTARVTHQILCELRDDPAVTLIVATNRTVLMERLGVPGYRLEDGKLISVRPTSTMPPSLDFGRGIGGIAPGDPIIR
jgi:ABC-type transporter Mla maintaining outer membrane lipid asymmetry ATPase subunit MlaF